MPNLDLTLPPSSTPAIQLYSVTTGLAVGSPISGSALSGRSTRYRFDFSSVTNGDYTADLSDPIGGFVVRKTTSEVRVAGQFWEFDTNVNTGTGARVVTITVQTSGAVPIQNATVRLTRTGETLTAITNVSGVAVFSADDATWTVSIAAAGYTFTPVSLAVDDAETVTYTMTSTGSITPSVAPQTTGYWAVYDSAGVLDPGAVVSLEVAQVPKTSTGLALDDTARQGTADANGIVAFTGMFPGVTYRVRVDGSSKYHNITVPAGAGTTVALGSIWG